MPTGWDYFEHFQPVLKLVQGKEVSFPVNQPGVDESDIEAIQEVVDRIPGKSFEVSGANRNRDMWLSIVVKRIA